MLFLLGFKVKEISNLPLVFVEPWHNPTKQHLFDSITCFGHLSIFGLHLWP